MKNQQDPRFVPLNLKKLFKKQSVESPLLFQVRRNPEQRVRLLLHRAGQQQPLAKLVGGPARRRNRLHLRAAAQRLRRVLGKGPEALPADDDLLGKLCKNWVSLVAIDQLL